MPTRLSRSRAFWNLRAEQVMDRVFHPSDATLQAVKVAVLPQSANAQQHADHIPRTPAPRQGLLIGTAILAVLGVGTSVWLAQNWQRSLQALNRERDLQMIERLRRIPMAGGDSTTPTAGSTVATAAGTPSTDPNPPGEAAARTASLQPLTLPLAGTLPVPIDAEVGDEAIAAAMVPAEPLLVGVVHAGGGQGSAIFQLDQLSLSATPGEAIGNSGWRLKTVQANSAVIEHNGEERSVSVGGAF